MGIPREQVKLFLQKSVNEGIIQGCCRTGSSQMVNGEYLPTKLSAVPGYIADLLSLQIEFSQFVQSDFRQWLTKFDLSYLTEFYCENK